MRIVVASHTFLNPYLVVGSHQLVRALAAAGHRVFLLSMPVSLPHVLLGFRASYRQRLAIFLRGGRQHEDGLFEYVPFTVFPWQIASASCFRTRDLFLNWIPPLNSILNERGFVEPDVLLVDDPRFVGLHDKLKSAGLFYRATDLNAEMKGDRRITEAERRLVLSCDGVIATSKPVLDRLRFYSPGVPALLLENGFDWNQFQREWPMPAEFASIPPPRAIYVGALDSRFDFDAIAQLSERYPQVSVVLIGPLTGHYPKGFDRARNVYCLGQKAHDTIPGYLQHSQVGLLPLNDHPANRGRSPMKFYEYAAAGLPVVYRETEELVRRAEPFALGYRDPAYLGACVNQQLSCPLSSSEIRRLSSPQSWSGKAAQLERFILERTTRARRPLPARLSAARG